MASDAAVTFDYTLVGEGGAIAEVSFAEWTLVAEGGGEAADLTAPDFTLEATGGQIDGATFDAAFDIFTLAATGVESDGGVASLEFEAFTLAATGIVGGTATLTFDDWTLLAAGDDFGGGTASIEFPAFLLTALGSDAFVATPDVETVLVNTRTGAHATYTNFPFTSMIEFNGAYLATGGDGIYVLGGDLDVATAIAASAEFGLSDLGVSNDKRVDSVWPRLRAQSEIDVSITYDETLEITDRKDTYALTTGIQLVRARGARGAQGNFIQIGVANVDGSDFEILDMEADVINLSRR